MKSRRLSTVGMGSLLGLIICLLSACDSGFATKFKAIQTTYQGNQLLTACLDLDQQYPREIDLKIALASLFMAQGEFDRARAYVNAADQLPEKASGQKATIQLLLSEYSFRDTDYVAASNQAAQAVNGPESIRYAALIQYAKSLAAQNKNDDALSQVQKAFALPSFTPTAEGVALQVELLIRHKDIDASRKFINDLYHRGTPPQGMGLQLSQVFEAHGLMLDAAVWTTDDVERSRMTGSITDAKVVTFIADVLTRLDSLQHNLKAQDLTAALLFTKVYQAFISGQDAVGLQLILTLPQQPLLPLIQYLREVLAIRTGNTSPQDLDAYSQLLPVYGQTIGYRYHLWRLRKNTEKSYSYATVKDLLETTILTAPNSAYAQETRREVGRLLGLSSDDSTHLLLQPELSKILSLAVESKAPDILEPYYQILALPDNPYTLTAVALLQSAIKYAPLHDMVSKRNAAEPNGRLHERLISILSGG
jgi:hypothetical protein